MPNKHIHQWQRRRDGIWCACGETKFGIDKYDICDNCGHYYFLHLNNFKGECDACDSPEFPLDDKCPGFKSEEDKENVDS